MFLISFGLCVSLCGGVLRVMVCCCEFSFHRGYGGVGNVSLICFFFSFIYLFLFLVG